MFAFRLTSFVGDVLKVKSMIREGVNVSHRFNDEKTPLHFAACQGKEQNWNIIDLKHIRNQFFSEWATQYVSA